MVSADQARAELSNSLLELSEQMAPILDHADGLRADLQRRGWSPTASECVALQWLTGSIGLMFTSTR